MNISISLTSSGSIDLSNFSEVNYFSGNGLKTIKASDLKDLSLRPQLTYHFVGDREIVINGQEIRFIESYK